MLDEERHSQRRRGLIATAVREVEAGRLAVEAARADAKSAGELAAELKGQLAAMSAKETQ